MFLPASTGALPAVGALVQVSGTVVEFRPGGAANNLTVTELSNPGRAVTVVSTGNPLPAPVVLGVDRPLPAGVVEDDTAGAGGDVEAAGVLFDPAEDALDLYESLEAMTVRVPDPVVTGPTNGFGEVWVLPQGGASSAPRTPAGSVLLGPDDTNPERVQLDDTIVFPATTPAFDVGDALADVTGVVDYNFSNFELLVTAVPALETAGGLQPEVLTLVRGAGDLTVAAFNVENLDPSDTTFPAFADVIVNRLGAPDIISVEEIQDNTGVPGACPAADPGNVVAADQTYAALVAAIAAAGGPAYEVRQVDPVFNQDGGQPCGNIRVGFLFRTDRGVAFVDRGEAGVDRSTTPTMVVTGPVGEPQVTLSPGRIAPTDPAWDASRKPLVGEFTFQGDTYFVVGNHFASKGGDQPVMGRFQPPVRVSEVQRLQQAALVNDFVLDVLAVDPGARVVVLGDINDFQFSEVAAVLTGGGALVNLYDTLPAEERWSYVFEGNAQVLDHILVSPALAPVSSLDVVHVNAAFSDQLSDHEPLVALIEPPARTVDVADADPVTEGGTATFTVTLSRPSGAPVDAAWSVVAGTAALGDDVAAASGTVSFAPGITTATVEVATVQDALDELDETFEVVVGTVTGPAVAGTAGTGTIVDDDPPPVASIGSTVVVEGDSGTLAVLLPVWLSTASGRSVTVAWSTLDGTARAPGDYVAAAGIVTFSPGDTLEWVQVDVVGDRRRERVEAFAVRISSPSGATLGLLRLGAVLVLDDDR